MQTENRSRDNAPPSEPYSTDVLLYPSVSSTAKENRGRSVEPSTIEDLEAKLQQKDAEVENLVAHIQNYAAYVAEAKDVIGAQMNQAQDLMDALRDVTALTHGLMDQRHAAEVGYMAVINQLVEERAERTIDIVDLREQLRTEQFTHELYLFLNGAPKSAQGDETRYPMVPQGSTS